MSELTRRRRARDLRISHGHLHAGFAAAVLLVAIAFAVGVLVGQRRAVSAVAPSEGVTGAVPGESLVELLARVDAASDPHSGVDRLTFPEALKGDAPASIPERPLGPQITGAIAPGHSAAEFDGDPLPKGAIVVEVGTFEDGAVARSVRDHLRARRLAAWMTIEIVDGRRAHRVGVGGFGTQAEARAILAEVETVLPTSPVAMGAPRIASP